MLYQLSYSRVPRRAWHPAARAAMERRGRAIRRRCRRTGRRGRRCCRRCGAGMARPSSTSSSANRAMVASGALAFSKASSIALVSPSSATVSCGMERSGSVPMATTSSSSIAASASSKIASSSRGGARFGAGAAGATTRGGGGGGGAALRAGAGAGVGGVTGMNTGAVRAGCGATPRERPERQRRARRARAAQVELRGGALDVRRRSRSRGRRDVRFEQRVVGERGSSGAGRPPPT